MQTQMQKFSDVVKQALELRQISVKQFAKVMSLSLPYIYDLLKENRRWNEPTMLKASEVLGIVIEYKIS